MVKKYEYVRNAEKYLYRKNMKETTNDKMLNAGSEKEGVEV